MSADAGPTVVRATTDAEILATRDVMRQLRPHLAFEEYLPTVRALMASDGYRLAALVDGGTVCAVAGYRLITMLHCGRALSVDDLVTDDRARSRGHGARLLEWLRAEGRAEGCRELQLISNVVRESAHRFYFREGLGVQAFYFRTPL